MLYVTNKAGNASSAEASVVDEWLSSLLPPVNHENTCHVRNSGHDVYSMDPERGDDDVIADASNKKQQTSMLSM